MADSVQLTCANCGRQIGALETGVPVHDGILCPECHARLSAASRFAAAANSSAGGAERPGEVFAIVSLVSGILGYVFLPFIGAIVAIVFGIMSRSESKSAGAAPSGMATAGIILGAIQLALVALILILVIFVLLFATVHQTTMMPVNH
jgi:DNA-directed RNA polymerase subunit RPC12/RpoP